jgi:hypothetical protein
MKRTFIFSFFSTLFFPSLLFAQTPSSPKYSAEDYQVVSTNQSVLQCGSARIDVITAFDAEILLSISNAISADKTVLSTDWQSFSNPSFSSSNFSEFKYKKLPQDMQRILFLCLSWNESERLKLFSIPDVALQNVANRLRNDRPWKTLPADMAKKADDLSDGSLKLFVYMVLRANVFVSSRGDLLKNKSLWFIPWNWLASSGDKS